MWYSARQLMVLPGMPSTLPALRRKALQEGWGIRRRKGEMEFWVERLPAEAQSQLPQEPPQPEPGDLQGWQRERMVARLAILAEVEARAQRMGLERAIISVVADASQGALSEELMRLIPIANMHGGRTLSRRTLYRWWTSQRQGSAALAPSERRGSWPAWGSTVLELYRRPTKPSLRWVHEQLGAHLPPEDIPSYWQILRFVRELSPSERERGRMGPRELKALLPFSRRNTQELWPGDVYIMDGHTFDAEIRHPLHGKAFRPEITTCLDIATRKIVGWSIALAESSWAVADALRHAVVTHGIPAILYSDKGSGYCNSLMDDPQTGILYRLGITKQTSIPYNSQARGAIERLHRTVWVRLAKTLPTYMGDDMDGEARKRIYKKTRGDLKAFGVSPLLLDLRAFERLCAEAVAAYNARPHRALPLITDPQTGKRRHQSPDEAWAAALAEGWEPVVVSPVEADDLFRPYQVRLTRRGEVSLFGNRYYHPALADYHEQPVKVGYDIHDASRVWVRDRNDRLICIADFNGNDTSYFPVTAIAEAAAKRAQGRLARAMRKIEDIQAEQRGLEAPAEGQPATPEEREAAAEMLARLQASQTPEPAVPELIPEPEEPEQPEEPRVERPFFATDFDLWLWVEAHPDQATDQDRAYLAQALEESPALRAQVDAELARRMRRCE